MDKGEFLRRGSLVWPVISSRAVLAQLSSNDRPCLGVSLVIQSTVKHTFPARGYTVSVQCSLTFSIHVSLLLGQAHTNVVELNEIYITRVQGTYCASSLVRFAPSGFGIMQMWKCSSIHGNHWLLIWHSRPLQEEEGLDNCLYHSCVGQQESGCCGKYAIVGVLCKPSTELHRAPTYPCVHACTRSTTQSAGHKDMITT